MFDPLKAKSKVLLYVALAFLVGIGTASGLGWTGDTIAMPVVDDSPQVTEEAIRPALDLSEAFVNIAEAVTPAVVRIETRRTARTASGGADQFRRFFNMPDPEDQPRLSGGSGFLISTDGYILTNDHVVSDAEEITVFLQDRRRYDATLVGSDPTTDVAVIRIDEEDLPTLSFGDSDVVRVGEWVLAVGNPGFGGGSALDYTVTAGIVSAKGRPLNLIQGELGRDPEFGPQIAQFAIEDFIQTDAVINPGNSGGPMVNLRAQVVGINSAIASQSGFYQGYGFAIPIDLARRVMEDLIEYGAVRRGYLGVRIAEVTPEDAEVYRLPDVSGVLIQDVPLDGPAADAGLQAEDVVVELDGITVSRPGQLQQLIARKRPGDRVAVSFYRSGRVRELTVRLTESPINEAPEREPVRAARAEEKLGIQVMDLTPDVAGQLQFEDPTGVIVEDVERLGPAGRRGIIPGMKILEINRESVETADDVKDILEDVAPGDIVTLRVQRATGQPQIVNVRVPN